jgi:hypothetical protein
MDGSVLASAEESNRNTGYGRISEEIDQFSPLLKNLEYQPSNMAHQSGNIEAHETSFGIPEQPHKLASTANSMKG